MPSRASSGLSWPVGERSSGADANAAVRAGGSPRAILPHLNPNVEWVQLASAGVDDWLLAEVVDSSRLWTSAKGVYAQPIAEYVVAMILASARRLTEVVNSHRWCSRNVESVAGKTVGVIGAGGIGRATLRLLRPFDVHTIAITRSGAPLSEADESLDLSGLDHLLAASDYVVLAAPKTPASTSLISERQLASMRDTAFLINVGRGALVDTEALVRAIRLGQLGGAALDVTDPEPLPDDHALWRLTNTFVTSHSACPPALGWRLFERRLSANVDRFAKCEELLGRIDLAAGY